MVLSDRVIRRLIEAGRIGIDPYDETLMQPSSLDVRVDTLFRVFRNSRYPYIDVKAEQEELTELVEVKGDEPFILHPGEFVLGSTLERVTLPDDLVARLEGKALALDTEIPTSQGWRLMAELGPGDIVFGADGEPTVVLAATEPLVGRPCKEVVFSDGTAVVCDAAHEWETMDKNGRTHGRRVSRVVTTAEIQRSLVVRGERNHQVPLASPVQYPERELPIDPYVFGAWLGDGTTTAAKITAADTEILDEIALAGYAVEPTRTQPLLYRLGGAGHTRDPLTGRYMPNESLSSSLRALGMSLGKRIPTDYLRSSVSQRQALLEGLMDTDGYVDRLGRCDLTTVREELAFDALELVSSLGFRPTLARKRALLDGRDVGPRFEIQFTPDRPCFRLPRKLERQKRRGRFHRFRAIADVRDVPSVPSVA